MFHFFSNHSLQDLNLDLFYEAYVLSNVLLNKKVSKTFIQQCGYFPCRYLPIPCGLPCPTQNTTLSILHS